MTALTGIAGEIEAAIGMDLTVRLLTAKGGMEINIPQKPEGSSLAAIIGDEACDAMLAAFGPGKLVLPMAHFRGIKARKARAMEMLSDGASLGQVCAACEISMRTATNYRAELDRSDTRQLRLPFDKG